MTIVLKEKTHISKQWLRRKIEFLLGSGYHCFRREHGHNIHSLDTSTESHRALVCSRHTHYDSTQLALDEELDAWVRHAGASNGFSDLP